MIDKTYIIAGIAGIAILGGVYSKGFSDGAKSESLSQFETIEKYKKEQAELKREHAEEIKDITSQLTEARSQAMKDFNDYTMRDGNEKARECITVPIGGSVWLRK